MYKVLLNFHPCNKIHKELTRDRVTDTTKGKSSELYEVRVVGHVVEVQVWGLDGPGEAGPVLQAVAESDADSGRAGGDGQGGVDLNRDLLFHGALNTGRDHYLLSSQHLVIFIPTETPRHFVCNL